MRTSIYAALPCVLALCFGACGSEERDLLPSDEQQIAALEEPATSALADYLRVHNTALVPDAPDWEEAMARIESIGNGFSLVHLAAIERTSYSEAQCARLDAVSLAIKTRLGDDSSITAETLVRTLERAAYADLMCDPLEASLPRWTMDHIAEGMGDPSVVEALGRIERGDYRPSFETKTLFSSLAERVPDYAKQILKKARG